MITIFEFERRVFGEDFSMTGSAPVEYLWSYLNELGARTCIRESEYVDRHYLSDYSAYYSRSFRAPATKCRRIHYFSLDKRRVEDLVVRAFGNDDERLEAEKHLENAYLGFVVCRPLKGANIGRTVLRTYPEDGGRRLYTATRRYHVHIGALHLSIDGLAFQQQDVGAAVCASTSLWCALQKVAVLSGSRTPTPNEITAASQSPFPASYGLDMNQMAMALSSLGFAADSFAPDYDSAGFRAKIGACLRSHLPVILILRGVDVGHAVTVTGHGASSRSAGVAPVGSRDGIPMRSGAISTLYVHDDNLGPHAHYELLDAPPEHLEDECYGFCDRPDGQLWLLRGSTGGPHRVEWRVDCWQIEAAIVPKPSKIRMPVDDLISAASSFRHLVQAIFADLELGYDVRFSTGVEYRRMLTAMNLDRARLRDFDFSLLLPRHVAVISVYLESNSDAGASRSCSDHLCDLLLDATTVDLCPNEESLLAIVAPGVPLRSVAWSAIEVICEECKIPAISAPAMAEV